MKTNRSVGGSSHTHTHTDIKTHWGYFLQTGFAVCRSGQNPKSWIRIHLNSRSLYLLLVVSSPYFSSLLFSSSHALNACRETSLPFPPWLSLFVSPSLAADALASQTSRQKAFCSSRPPSAAAPPLSHIHPLFSGCVLAFERTAGALDNTEGKEGWRKQGGVDVGCGEVVADHQGHPGS